VKPLSLRTRLAFFYSVVFALLLAGFAAIFYRVVAFRLEKAFNQELIERAAALRGYLRFESGQPSLAFDATDPDEGFFIRTATRYFQVYDIATGKLLTQSSDLRLISLEYKIPAKVFRPRRSRTFLSDFTAPIPHVRERRRVPAWDSAWSSGSWNSTKPRASYTKEPALP
jgi:hypothetical protein